MQKYKNQQVKKAVYAKTKLRQKEKIEVVPLTSTGTSKKTNTRVLNKSTIITNANKNVVKRKKIKEVNCLHEQERLLAFLKKYTNTYEQKDLHRFRTFFMEMH